jgi:hypothetical protein
LLRLAQSGSQFGARHRNAFRQAGCGVATPDAQRLFVGREALEGGFGSNFGDDQAELRSQESDEVVYNTLCLERSACCRKGSPSWRRG